MPERSERSVPPSMGGRRGRRRWSEKGPKKRLWILESACISRAGDDQGQTSVERSTRQGERRREGDTSTQRSGCFIASDFTRFHCFFLFFYKNILNICTPISNPIYLLFTQPSSLVLPSYVHRRMHVMHPEDDSGSQYGFHFMYCTHHGLRRDEENTSRRLRAGGISRVKFMGCEVR